jgi:thiol:disulfide interchange protein DsbD
MSDLPKLFPPTGSRSLRAAAPRRVGWCRTLWLAVVAASVLGTAAVAAQTRSTPAQSTPPGAGGSLDVLRSPAPAVAPPQPELLLPDEAFRIQMHARDVNTIVAVLTPAPGYYLYRDRINFKLVDAPGLSITRVVLPPGKDKDDPTFGPSQVFYETVEAVITLAAAATGPLAVRAGYQGCNEPVGVCYPPIEKTLTVSFAGLGTGVATGVGGATPGASLALDFYDEQAIQRLFGNGASWALLAAFFGFGSGDGNTVNDIVTVDDLHVKLRAERSGNGSGRIYTMTYVATDACGNSSETASTTVTVPHSMGK